MIKHLTPLREPIGHNTTTTEKTSESIHPKLSDYLKTIKSPIKAARIKHTLGKVQGFSGTYQTRLSWALANYKSVAVDIDENRIYKGTNKIAKEYSFYEFKDITKTLAIFILWLQFNK